MTKLIPHTSQMRGVLRRLRPPCARPLTVNFFYTSAQRINPGYTLGFPEGENALAPGDGQVIAIGPLLPFWAFSPGSAYLRDSTIQVVIDHGSGLKTVLHGLSSVTVQIGQPVTRGQVIGTPQTSEVFFALLYLEQPYDPVQINRHFRFQNAAFVPARPGSLRFAPDFSLRNFSESVLETVTGGLHYFYNALCQRPAFLLNIAFNGNKSKSGAAVTGIGLNDFWNDYEPVSFTATLGTGSGGLYGCLGYTFSSDPVAFLFDYAQRPSPVWLERQSLVSVAGTAAWFDPMLSRFAGGYSGGVPYENTFSLRDVPSGNYVLYLYANQGTPPATSTCYVSVDNGTPQAKTNIPTTAAVFVENANFVKFNLSLVAAATIHVKVYGYLAGLQLSRA